MQTNVPFVDIIDRIGIIEWQNRIRMINGHPTGLFDMTLPRDIFDARIGVLGKFRQDYKPFIGHISTHRLREIRSDVVELVTFFTKASVQLVIVESSQYGLRQAGIEEHFSSFLPQNGEEKWTVNLVPIFSRKGISDVERSEQVRALEIKFNLAIMAQNLINIDVDTTRSSILHLFKFFGECNNNIDAQTIRIEFGSGQGRNQTMNLDSVLRLLHCLNIDHDAIEYLKVRFRDVRTNHLDTIDLKNHGGQLKDRILENDPTPNPGWEYIGNNMIGSFHNNECIVYDAFTEHIRDQVVADIPEIIIEPPEVYRISGDIVDD